MKHRVTGSLLELLGGLPADRSEGAVRKIRNELSVGHVVFFDGAIRTWRDGTRIAAFGYVHTYDGYVLGDGGGVIEHSPDATSNVAEYGGICGALGYVWRTGLTPVTIVGDSRLIIDQVEGRCRTNAPKLVPLRDRALRAIRQLDALQWEVTLRWVVRQANTLADARADRAYNEYLLEMIK